MAYCNTCKAKDAIRVQIKYYFNKQSGMHEKMECCDRCSSIEDQAPRDALGHKVVGYKHGYSYATDSVHTSKREFAEHLKEHDLIQKDGNLINGGKKKWK